MSEEEQNEITRKRAKKTLSSSLSDLEAGKQFDMSDKVGWRRARLPMPYTTADALLHDVMFGYAEKHNLDFRRLTTTSGSCEYQLLYGGRRGLLMFQVILFAVESGTYMIIRPYRWVMTASQADGQLGEFWKLMQQQLKELRQDAPEIDTLPAVDAPMNTPVPQPVRKPRANSSIDTWLDYRKAKLQAGEKCSFADLVKESDYSMSALKTRNRERKNLAGAENAPIPAPISAP